MKTFIQHGHSLDYVAPAGGVVSGVALLLTTVLVVPATTASEGETFSGWIEGVYTLPCATGTAWNMNDALYWDAGNKRLTTTANNNTLVGMAAAPKPAGDNRGAIKLLPQVGIKPAAA